MANRTQTVAGRIFIADAETAVISFRTSHGTDQPIGTCDITMTLPLPTRVALAATVEAEVGIDGIWHTVFAGNIREIDDALDVSGRVARLACEGHNHRLDLPLEVDLAWTGGNPVSPTTLEAGTIHVGDETLANYDEPTPEGTSVNRTFVPPADAAFVTIAGRLHSTASISSIEVYQSSVKLGYAKFPVAEDEGTEDFDDDDNWEDFSLVIAAPITVAAGTVTVLFVAGHTTGSAVYDDYEVKALTWATSDKTSVRDLGRSLYVGRGFPALGLPYRVDTVVDIDDVELKLGGNPLVDAGQVRVDAPMSPLSFWRRITNLFGYRAFDTPMGTSLTTAVRGTPDVADAVLTLVEGTDPFRIERRRDARPVVNWWTVEGASVNDADGVRHTYRSVSVEPPTHPVIPDPPGIVAGRVSENLLVSDGLCQAVREVREIDTADVALVLSFETWPRAIQPGEVIAVEAPSLADDPIPFWLTRVGLDVGPNGIVGHYEGWAGSGEALPEAPDTVAATIDTDPHHIGDETLAGWVVPVAEGTTVTLPFTALVCDGVRISGRSHGANDFVTETPSVWSTMQVWQSGSMKGSARVPQSPKGPHHDYTTSNAHWRTFTVDIAAELTAGAAELKFVAGTGSSSNRDDYEVKDLTLKLTGLGDTIDSSTPIEAGTWRPYTPLAGVAD